MDLSECFSHKCVSPGIYLCREKYFAELTRCNIWIIQGRDMDLVIDAGTGVWDIRAYLEQNDLIGSKPTLAVATHIHFDHTGGLHYFDNVAIHEAEAEFLAEGDNYASSTLVVSSNFSLKPKGWRAKDFRVKKVKHIARILKHGDTINLGEKTLRVIHSPGHSLGSIMLFDQERKHLFSGDVAYDGHIIDIMPHSDIETYRETFRKVIELADDVTQVFPGHYDIFDGVKLKEIANNYMVSSSSCLRNLFRKMLRCAVTAYLNGKYKSCPASPSHYACCCCCIRAVIE